MPIDEIINDSTNMAVGAVQGATADQLPETIVVTPDANLERPTDVRLPKDVNWYNNAIDVFNLEMNTKLPKVADAVEIADDDYKAVEKHFNDRVVNDYNKTNENLKLGLPLVTDISEIKAEDFQKIDEAKVATYVNQANKDLKMAQDMLGGDLLKFEPFKSVEDIRNRVDDFKLKLGKATNTKDKNRLLSDVNKYITNANKKTGLNVPLFSNADDAKKAITLDKNGIAPLAKQFEILSLDKQPGFGDELRNGLLNPMASDLPEKNLLDRQKAMAEREMADLERSKKTSADIARLNNKRQKDGNAYLEDNYLQYLNKISVHDTREEADAQAAKLIAINPKMQGVGVKEVDGKFEVFVPERMDAQYYKDAQNITAEGALIKAKQANALMPEYKALKEEINRYTMQGIAVPPQTLAKYDEVSSTIQDYLTASRILTDVSVENYVKHNNLEGGKGNPLKAIALEGVESFNSIIKGVMKLGLTLPEIMMSPLPSNVAENTDVMKATQKGKEKVDEFFEKRTRYLQDVFGIAPQYRGGYVTESFKGAVGILPYILGGELAVPFMVVTGVDANLEALKDEKNLSTNEKNLIALVKGSIGAYIMSKGLDVVGGHTAVNKIAYNAMKDLPVNFTGKTLQNVVGKEVTQYVANASASSATFGALNVMAGVTDIGVNELAKVATDKRFNPQASHDVLKDLSESFIHGLGTGFVLSGVTGAIKLGADNISNEREFRQMDAMVQDPSLIPILKLKLGQQVVDKKISAEEYKKAIANINSVANIASQIPKDFSNSSRYQSFKLLKENAEYEKQKAGLAPVYIKRIDGLIEANNAELIKIADKESVKSTPNDTQNPETTNSESATTNGTNEVSTQETKAVDDGVKVKNDVVNAQEEVSKDALKDVEEDSEKWYKAKKTIKDKDGNDIKLTIDKNKDDKHFYIKATDSNGKEVGSALFETSDGEVWSGNEIEVNEANRRKGIMSAMYDFAESEGHPLEPTKTLSKEGKAFWDNRKAPTQYTEAATPPKKETSGVSGSALKDVEVQEKKKEIKGYDKLKEVEKNGGYIKTDETITDKDYETNDVEHKRTKAYKVEYVVKWMDTETNSDPDVETFSSIDEAHKSAQTEGDWWNGTQDHIKIVEPVYKEVWLNSDGSEFEEVGKGVNGDTFIETKEGKKFIGEMGFGKYDNYSDVYSNSFGKRDENSRELESTTYHNLGGDLETTFKAENGETYTIKHSGKGKYSSLRILDKEGDEIDKVQLRVADHTYNPRNNDDAARSGKFISVEIANINATKGKFNTSYSLQFDGTDTYENVLETVKERLNEILENKIEYPKSKALATNTIDGEQKSITTKGNELADKIRSLKSKKGTLQSDITGGLKDYALEEIAQLIEDGTVVIEAIKKVLSDAKYAKLDKNEIRDLVFSANPLTEKDFERTGDEKVVDRNKRLTKELQERGYGVNEIDYILKGGVERIEKVDMVREETKVVKLLNKILSSIKNKPIAEAVDIAINQIEWEKGKEIIFENAIRKFKKEHGVDAKTPVDRAVKPKPVKITVNEKKALTDQIKLEVKAATEGAKSITDGFKAVAKVVHEILKEHKTSISTRQLDAIQKRMAYLKVGSDESVRKYVDYIEKVLANAEYADQLAAVKSTNKKLKKALKNDKIPASVRATANDFIKLDPADVADLNKHEAYANELLEAMKSGGIKVQDGNIVDKTRKAANLSKIDNYIEKEMELAEKRAEQSMNEEYITTTEAEDNTDEIKAYVQRKFDRLKSWVGDVLRTGTMIDGTQHDFTPEEVSMIKKVMGMKLDQLDNVKDWYEAIEALDHLLTNGDLGLIPHILNKYDNAVTVKKGTQILINKMAGNISLLPITKFFAEMEKVITIMMPFGKRNAKDSYGTKIYFDNSSFRRWDNLVKNFKDNGIYENTFYHLAKAYANYKTLVRKMDAQRIRKELFRSNGYDQKKTLESKFKITAFLRQLEFESNPESKTNKPAIDYLNATIEAAENLNHPIQGKALDMLKDVVSKHTVDGQISLESLRNSFTQGEKTAIAAIQKIYKMLAPYHNKVSLAIRNRAFTAIENYTHMSAYGTKTKGLSATETKKNEYLSVLQGTKSGTIEERSGATSPINMDPFATANKAIRDVMLDYFMTNPFRNVEKILDNFAKHSIEELKKYPRGTAEYKNALKRKNIAEAWLDIYSDARENMLGRSYFETNQLKEFMQLAAKRSVEFTLGVIDRLVAELLSNMGYVMSSATKEFTLGSTKYLKYNGAEIQAKIMENVLSSATERLHPHGGIATSVMDTQDFDIAVADNQNLLSPEMRKALQFYYKTLAKAIGKGQKAIDGLITSGDLLIARPIWTGTMATEFKKITGKDIDFDKIAENDIEYMDTNEDAIDKARTVADRKVTDAAASKNPFETAPKMSNRSTQILQALNTYMRGFNMGEYELSSDALMHLVNGGKMSREDATRILAGITARAGLYKAVQAKVATAMMAAIMGGWARLQNDEEKTEVDKLIGNMGDDTLENRRKVADKLLELFWKSNPNIPELKGMGEVGDALKTTDEETVKFWERASKKPNTFIEDVVKGIGQQYLSLLTQRNFGNIVQGFITAPIFEEYINKKMRDDYDPYKDSYLYGKLPDTDKKNWLIRSVEANLGAYGLPMAMLMDITVAGIELRANVKKLDAVNEELKKHIDKVPLEKNRLEDFYALKDRQKALEKKIEDGYKRIAKEVTIAAGMGTGAIPALKSIDKSIDKIMQDAYKLPKDWDKIQEKIEAIKNGVAPEDIMNAQSKEKAVSEIYEVIEPGEKMPDKYDDAIKKVLEK